MGQHHHGRTARASPNRGGLFSWRVPQEASPNTFPNDRSSLQPLVLGAAALPFLLWQAQIAHKHYTVKKTLAGRLKSSKGKRKPTSNAQSQVPGESIAKCFESDPTKNATFPLSTRLVLLAALLHTSAGLAWGLLHTHRKAALELHVSFGPLAPSSLFAREVILSFLVAIRQLLQVTCPPPHLLSTPCKVVCRTCHSWASIHRHSG